MTTIVHYPEGYVERLPKTTFQGVGPLVDDAGWWRDEDWYVPSRERCSHPGRSPLDRCTSKATHLIPWMCSSIVVCPEHWQEWVDE